MVDDTGGGGGGGGGGGQLLLVPSTNLMNFRHIVHWLKYMICGI